MWVMYSLSSFKSGDITVPISPRAPIDHAHKLLCMSWSTRLSCVYSVALSCTCMGAIPALVLVRVEGLSIPSGKLPTPSRKAYSRADPQASNPGSQNRVYTRIRSSIWTHGERTAIKCAKLPSPRPATSSSAQSCTMVRVARPTTCPKGYAAGVSVTLKVWCSSHWSRRCPSGKPNTGCASRGDSKGGAERHMIRRPFYSLWRKGSARWESTASRERNVTKSSVILSGLGSETISDELHNVSLCSLIHIR